MHFFNEDMSTCCYAICCQTGITASAGGGRGKGREEGKRGEGEGMLRSCDTYVVGGIKYFRV